MQKSKRFNKNGVDDELKHEDYNNVLSNATHTYMNNEMNRFKNKNHTMEAVELIKVFFFFYDNIYRIGDGYH